MAGCAPPQSVRNRILVALLPVAVAPFRFQDIVYRLIGKTSWGVPTYPPSVPMSEAAPYAPEHGCVRDRHGYRLFYRCWPAHGRITRAVLVAFDGMGSDAKQFRPIGEYLAPRAIAFFALDLPGQGFSEGPRSDWTRLPGLVDGVDDVILYLNQRYPDAPMYLLGESIGGSLVLQLAAGRSHPPNLAGLILASPELVPTRLTAGSRWSGAWTFLGQVPYFLFASKAPSVDITGREKLVARTPDVYRRSMQDPLRNHRVSVRTLVAVLALIARSPELAKRTTLPTLVLQASCDLVNDPEAAASLVTCLATGDKELVYFEGAAHGLFYDPDTPRVLRVIGDWLDDHLDRWKAPPRQREPAPRSGDVGEAFGGEEESQ